MQVWWCDQRGRTLLSVWLPSASRRPPSGPPTSDAGEELEHARLEQRGRFRIVGGQRVVGEVGLVARIQEELRVGNRGDDLTGRVDVTLVDEDRVVVRAVDLDRDSLRPRPERR